MYNRKFVVRVLKGREIIMEEQNKDNDTGDKVTKKPSSGTYLDQLPNYRNTPKLLDRTVRNNQLFYNRLTP